MKAAAPGLEASGAARDGMRHFVCSKSDTHAETRDEQVATKALDLVHGAVLGAVRSRMYRGYDMRELTNNEMLQAIRTKIKSGRAGIHGGGVRAGDSRAVGMSPLVEVRRRVRRFRVINTFLRA